MLKWRGEFLSFFLLKRFSELISIAVCSIALGRNWQKLYPQFSFGFCWKRLINQQPMIAAGFFLREISNKVVSNVGWSQTIQGPIIQKIYSKCYRKLKLDYGPLSSWSWLTDELQGWICFQRTFVQVARRQCHSAECGPENTESQWRWMDSQEEESCLTFLSFSGSANVMDWNIDGRSLCEILGVEWPDLDRMHTHSNY